MKIRKATETLTEHPAAKPFAILLAIGVAVRLVGLAFPPNIYNDTEHYVYLARRLATLQLAGYDGLSAPVYPLFLALTGLNFQVVKVVQYILGIAIAGMLFTTVYRRTESSSAALVSGIVFCLTVAELAFEQAILTETMATFMLAVSAMKLQRILSDGEVSVAQYSTLGALTGLTGLTRPLYAFLVPLYLIFLAVASRRSPSRRRQLTSSPAPQAHSW
jgi:Dolichyl-phosphate-mannose-protein mannosyltransferase